MPVSSFVIHSVLLQPDCDLALWLHRLVASAGYPWMEELRSTREEMYGSAALSILTGTLFLHFFCFVQAAKHVLYVWCDALVPLLLTVRFKN